MKRREFLTMTAAAGPGPITCAADGRQQVAVAAEAALYVFGLPDD